MAKKPVALIILDGFGLRDEVVGNAVKAAKMPNFKRYYDKYPHGELTAQGNAVGLPEGQMGNSEVGHLNIGAGRIVYQSLTRINLAVKNGEFNTDATIEAAVKQAVANGKKVHVLGLLSPGGIHSHSSHMDALVEAAKHHGANDVFVHAFLDGRDVLPKSALGFIEAMEAKLSEIGVGKIATVSGRYYAMDRDKNFDRTQLSYDAMTKGAGEKFASATEGVEASYKEDTLDEFVLPFVVDEKGLIESGDTVIFANFRPDRAQQLAIAFSNPAVLPSLQVEGKAALHPLEGLEVNFVSMMTYGKNVNGPIIFDLQNLANTYGEVIANNGMNQLRVAETEKYAHVTFFFDGGVDKELPGATRVLVNSPQVATYDLKPEMSAYEVAEKTVAEINKDVHDTIILNFANPDMVGHTGSMEATVACLEAVDKCLGDVVEAILAKGGYVIITADHGNAEMLIDDNGQTWTAHTISPVPVIITKEGIEIREGGVLGDLAPTLLDLLGVAQPVEMTGKTLIK
ncbi:MAG: 2,3-bisphosphoglycerate-independent phosphoglycerate mutase [Turicibacter sp.]|nr:2,3-bisphosphoglycerate-independent phosphoglycerate mutase [Turicibacter sp.]